MIQLHPIDDIKSKEDMSSSEDSETAEWEREQMLRGSQSRGRQQHTSSRQRTATSDPAQTSQNNSFVIDASHAKRHVKCDIDKAEREIEIIKRNIGTTRVDIVRAEKRRDAMKKYIEQLEQANPFFEELARLKETEELIQYLDKSRALISKLPPDQKETIDLLEENIKRLQAPAMEVDN